MRGTRRSASTSGDVRGRRTDGSSPGERCASCGQPVGYWATDRLTGLLDRWGWDDKAPDALGRARRRGQPAALLIIDLDYFKRINDEFGHLAGDAFLRSSAGVIRAATGDAGLAGRYGGDEFLGLLPGADTVTALAVAERIRDGIRGMRIRVEAADGTAAGITGRTASIGIAGGDLVAGVDLVDLLREADDALREAKLAGGDRVRVAHPWSGGRPPRGHPRSALAGQPRE